MFIIFVFKTLREMYQAIQEGSENDSCEHKFEIKWPNDIYFGDSKVCLQLKQST